MTTITKKQRAELRMKFGGRCAYCGCELPEKGWHADHVEAVLRKSEQCMKAAAKGIFKLKATGEFYRPEAEWAIRPYFYTPPARDNKQTDELVMWVKRLAHSLRNARPNSKLHDAAMDYLSRNGLISVEGVLR